MLNEPRASPSAISCTRTKTSSLHTKYQVKCIIYGRYFAVSKHAQGAKALAHLCICKLSATPRVHVSPRSFFGFVPPGIPLTNILMQMHMHMHMYSDSRPCNLSRPPSPLLSDLYFFLRFNQLFCLSTNRSTLTLSSSFLNLLYTGIKETFAMITW
jgi:hypothetical protein